MLMFSLEFFYTSDNYLYIIRIIIIVIVVVVVIMITNPVSWLLESNKCYYHL